MLFGDKCQNHRQRRRWAADECDHFGTSRVTQNTPPFPLFTSAGCLGCWRCRSHHPICCETRHRCWDEAAPVGVSATSCSAEQKTYTFQTTKKKRLVKDEFEICFETFFLATLLFSLLFLWSGPLVTAICITPAGETLQSSFTNEMIQSRLISFLLGSNFRSFSGSQNANTLPTAIEVQ